MNNKPAIRLNILLYPKDILFLTMLFLIFFVASVGFLHSKKFEKKEIFFRKKFILNHQIILNNPSLNSYFSSLILSLYTFFQEFLFDIRFNLNDNSIFSNFVAMKKAKYLLAYLLPVLVGFSFLNEGWVTFLPLIIYFGLLPFELFIKPDSSNWDPEQIEKKKVLFMTL